MQFMSTNARAAIAQRWHAGPRRISREAATAMVDGIELIGIRQLRGYFPDAEIVIERIAGLPKSIVAARRA